ncbi:GerAB/ArcD/ProY family transporter [Candidatus Woesearchaeota archaeon]|nr:GerAB/ArcD/ProY family transporter [Candidatus Woesearchaeota archaeon]
MPKKELYEAIATLVGVVIGAGVLGIPYVVQQAGLWIGLLDIALIGIAILFINLFLGEIVLRTKGDHQLTGYASKYLGKWGKALMAFSMIFGIYGAMIAYLIGEGKAFAAIFGGNPLIWSLVYFAFVAFIVYIGLKAVEESELFMSAAFIIVIVLICILAFGAIKIENLAGFDLTNIMVPYGVILFAFLGAVGIPEMKEELINNRKCLKKAIIIGSLIPLLVYLLFAFVVVGASGAKITEVATIGLGRLLGEKMVILGNLFAVFAMATSFIALGLALQEMYNYDYKLGKKLSWALSCFVPLLIFFVLSFFGMLSFVSVLGITGAVAGGIDGVLIAMMFLKAKTAGDRKPEYVLNINKGWCIILAFLFILGIIHQMILFFV